ncbi:DNA-processing protein DprA [Cellulomonas endometrii]|uniref:DNA-processing protein DprA n=1 Tax=Cellulomonas endometrii TaxID=3036301 RepID=UPI0024AE591F|nr:DNA-processing protein DprA [Cellulomonas endometrii]
MPGAADPSEAELLARAAWSIVAEPGDAAAGAVVAALGAPTALRWAAQAVGETPEVAWHRLRGLVHEGGAPGAGAAGPTPVAGAPGGAGTASTVRVLARALPRWAPRLDGLDPGSAMDALAREGGVLLVPGGPGWPARLDDLGPLAPLCLWVRGGASLDGLTRRSVAVVGARASTPYGEHVAVGLGGGLAPHGVTVVSGGAYGIDVAAHRGALAAGGPTVALLAGGIDRPSPAGNRDLLERVVADGGALVAESPPGTPPTRSRFLQRNRLIAAVSGATVVVEAAWRSGALSTAARAAELLRPLGAVPGPVTSMASTGCHRLLRDGAAVCVTGADDVLDLLGPAVDPGAGPRVGTGAAGGAGLTPGRDGPGGSGGRGASGASAGAGVTDRADSVPSRVLDALLQRRALAVDEVARRAGLAPRETAGALGLLELDGAAQRVDGGWRRAPERRSVGHG